MSKARVMGFWSCVALVMGNMIGSGIFLMPSLMAGYGVISIWGWAISGCGALLLALVFANLARSVGGEGGPYAYTREAYGDFAAYLCAWCYWKTAWIGNAAIAVTVIGYLAVFFPALANPVAGALTAIGFLWVMTVVNLRGVKLFSLLQNIFTILKLIPLVLIGVVGWFFFDFDNVARPVLGRSIPETSLLAAISSVTALTMWSFLGLESATVPADGVVNPKKTIPRATLFGTFAAGIVYFASVTVVLGMLPARDLIASTAPFADAARIIIGDIAYYLIAAGAIVAAIGALNGWILLQGQIPMAAARDGLLPEALAKVNRHGVPANALVTSSILVSILIAMNFRGGLVDAFQTIVLVGTMTTLVPYAFCATALLQLMVDRRAIFPARIVFSAVAALLAFAFALWALYGSGEHAVFWGFLVMISGLPLYTWRKWREKATAAKTATHAPAE